MQTPQDKQYIRKQPPELFYKKCALKNFAKFTGKHLCQSLFFNKVAGFRPDQQMTNQLIKSNFEITKAITFF